ncbi:hypothetical protein B0A48_17008 [Cryoendolithus antarcticus]|uniref:Uncharacterized protein n=1 Tax=Cryoendolithus antarcticus TaxID=1507870 RepID=A0A1V8SBK7_9PEZI|nr:hypothetical protein B0A48_17008 [Cryoendolithus antarcticus]
MGELDPSLYDGKMAMVTHIQAYPFTQHFELQDFSFAFLNTSGRCTLHVKGYRDDNIDTPTVVAS